MFFNIPVFLQNRNGCITIIKNFRDSYAAAVTRLASCGATGGTPDAAAIAHAGARLAAQPEGIKILLVIADGEGSPPEVLARIIKRQEKAGIICIGIGIAQHMSEAFAHRARVDDVAKLQESGLGAILKALAHGETAATVNAAHGGD